MSKQIQKNRFSGIRAMVRSQLIETGAPSLAVAIAQNGTILLEEGFGWANREDRIRATSHTLYPIASISKPMTATGLMILKERGLIDLDRPINDYLGEVKLRARIGDVENATVRRVANHTAGLPHHFQVFYEDEPYIRPSIEQIIERYGNLVTPPGAKYQYSNLGYGVLGYAIAHISGKSYGDFMREEVFIPLNMFRTSVGIGPGLEKYQAIGYGPSGMPLPFYEDNVLAAGGIFCSVHDLVQFGMFHLKDHLPEQKAILSDAAIDEMQTITWKFDEDSGYGIGWGIYHHSGYYRSVQHGGQGCAQLSLLPEEKIAIGILTNTENEPLIDSIEAEILSALLPRYGAYRASREAEQKQEEDGPSSFQPTSDLLGVWVGTVHTYKGKIPLMLEFQEDGDIHAKLGDQLKTLINDADFEENYLTGLMLGDIYIDDSRRGPYLLSLNLNLRQDVLNGAINVYLLPGQRESFGLAHWTELKKQ